MLFSFLFPPPQRKKKLLQPEGAAAGGGGVGGGVLVQKPEARSQKPEGTGLAGLRRIAVRLGFGVGIGGNRPRKKSKKKIKIRKVKDKLMDVWHKMIFPVRRVWLAVSSRVKARKNGTGLLKLHDDIQTCGYQDVQVMWEMLRRSESELIDNHPKRKPFWRVSVWSNHSADSS
ncbi:MAGUK p55 subfamily member 4 like [Quillaja saponaria]|uniref:MAGUK p55 subfamily member 4 like n=1 Tax=Quillaja saponaria TaxID=32244 RepID=A0AAD7LSP9_QUISA|nr:MAGUK p55 subfamily member 4 like [Quillaja saponaria]